METPTRSNSLEDENTGIRASAIIEMGRTGNRDAVESIIEVLENREEVDWLRGCAAIALGRLSGDEVIPPLVNALRDDNILVCRAVISALGDAKNKQVIPHLKTILENRDKEELHPVTVKVLGEIGGEEIIPTLLQALESSNDLVRIRAALALGEMHSEEAVPYFIGLINDNNESLRAIAASSLGLIGDMQAVEPLINALGDKAGTVRAIAASSLGCIADSSAISPLEKALDDDNEAVRKQAAAALSKIKNNSSN
jgi:HEAT repeat protein